MNQPMETKLDCLPCLLRQALEAARQVTEDEEVQRAVMDRVSQTLRFVDARKAPPVMAQKIHRIIRAEIGDDPFRLIKNRMNRFGVRLRTRLRPRVEADPDPFAAALRLAIAANCIDFATRRPTARDVTSRLEAALTQPLDGPVAELARACRLARKILYLADNAGEIAFDALLIEQLPPGTVTVAVRGRPVINDATLADARAVGLTRRAKLLENGSDAPGTLLADCSPAFVAAFRAADLIIAKGQGNFESLTGIGRRPIFYLLIPKCPLVARHLGAPEDTLVVRSELALGPAASGRVGASGRRR